MNKTWLAIHREASLAAEHLASGATMLGKANYAQQAYYYQAFFALSVGFERSAKLSLAVDNYLREGDFQTKPKLHSYGHNLDPLLDKMDSVARTRGLTDAWATLPHTAIHDGIVCVLSEFAANMTRYFNLDIITNSQGIGGVVDPLELWHKKVFLPVAKLHYSAKRRVTDQANADAVAYLLGDNVSVLHVSETGDILTDPSTASAMTGMTKAVQPYVRMYVLQLARFVYTVMSDLGHSAFSQGCQDIPHLSEYFAIFCNDDVLFRKRATWSIHAI